MKSKMMISLHIISLHFRLVRAAVLRKVGGGERKELSMSYHPLKTLPLSRKSTEKHLQGLKNPKTKSKPMRRGEEG
ncbi:hypothetical protein X975_02548, partial [Stegodyphus mimosarum]